MPRSIKSASGGSTFVSPVTVRQGGLGTTNAADALLALNGISANQLGAPHGIAKLNSGGLPDSSLFAGLSLSESCIDGPKSIQVGTANDYFLTTYDSFEDYKVTATVGTVVRNKNVITYTAAATAGIGGFAVNGRAVVVVMTDGITAIVATPSIVAPVSGAAAIDLSTTVTASAFMMAVGTDTHVSSDWQIASDATFATLLASSDNDTTNLTTWMVNGMQSLTKYYIRTRQKSSSGKLSDWSAVSNFTTKAGYPLAEQAELLASDGWASDGFGSKVSLSSDGNTALIGASGKTGTYTNQGAAYVFIRSGSTWTQQAKLLPGDPATGDNFGCSVSLSNDGSTALIAAYYKNGTYVQQGAAYVFIRSGSTWSQQAKLLHSDKAANDNFGYSVSLSSNGNTALIGAPGKNSNKGAAYVFTRVGSAWTQQAKLLDSGNTSGYLGDSVSLSFDSNTALIGASATPGSTGSYEGAAYVFTRSGTTWTQQAKLIASDFEAWGVFGVSVALSSDGNVAVIGSSGWSSYVAYSKKGAAYVFIRSGSVWTQQTQLLASDPAANDYFGDSVSLSGDGNTLLIGADGKGSTYGGQGAAYVFIRFDTTWTQKIKLLASDPAQSSYFGSSVSLSNDGSTALIGARGMTVAGASSQGAAYVFV